MMKDNNDSVGRSRAGDVFHYRWAARRCLQLIEPNSKLDQVMIEGAKETELSDEYSIDVAEYFRSENGKDEDIRYYQLKHSEINADKPFNLSDLETTITSFSRYYSELGQSKNIRFEIVTNRLISKTFKENILKIKNGNSATKNFQNTLEKYTQLSGNNLQKFCLILELNDHEGGYREQKDQLLYETSKFFSSSTDCKTYFHSLLELIQEKILPKSNKSITKEDILKRLGVNSEDALFPAPIELEDLYNAVSRSQQQVLLTEIKSATNPIIIQAGSGVGKSMMCRQIVESLDKGSVGIIYDCYGKGSYLTPSKKRHRHRDALIQIINELASRSLCKWLIPTNNDLSDQLLKIFLSRLESTVKTLRQSNIDSMLVILIDAADNAEMAAKDYDEECFVHELLKEKIPEGCKIIALCRPERTDLLKPSSSINIINLEPFSLNETRIYLQEKFKNLTENDVLEFHQLTGGNPRIQAKILSKAADNFSEILSGLGTNSRTVDDVINQQFSEAISSIKKTLPEVHKKEIDAICVGLATLHPFIPIKELAAAAKVPEDTVKSFVVDFGTSILITNNAIQFLDEPTESWFKENFPTTNQEIESYIDTLTPFASESSYVAQTLPFLLLKIDKYNELIDLALSDKSLPENNLIDRRNVKVYRLQFALKAALRKKNYPDAVKLALVAGEEVAGNNRKIDIIKNNIDLFGYLQTSEQSQDLAYRKRQDFSGRWRGSEHVYSASLLSFIPDSKGSATNLLRSSMNWLNMFLKESKKDDHNENLEDVDILELVFAHFRLNGEDSAVKFLVQWRPLETIFKISSTFIRRLIDAGKFEAIEKIAQIGCIHQELILAINNELMKVGRYSSLNTLQICLENLELKNILDNSRHDAKQSLLAIISLLEASAITGINSQEILKKLNKIPLQRGSYIIDRFNNIDREIFLRVIALKYALKNIFCISPENIYPKDFSEKNLSMKNKQDIEEFNQIIGGLLPFYFVRSKIFLGLTDAVEVNLKEAIELSKKAIKNRYLEYDRIPFEINRARFEILMFYKNLNFSEIKNFKEELSSQEFKFELSDSLQAVRAAYRLEHLEKIRIDLIVFCSKTMQISSKDNPSIKANEYLDLARAVLSCDVNEARAYLEKALDIISRVGDEIGIRWNAIVDLAKRYSSSTVQNSEIAYRFIRVAELVGDTVDREKYWDRYEAIKVCASLCVPSSLSALSRWKDRGVGSSDYQISILAKSLVSSKSISASAGWALSAFSFENSLNDLSILCIENESSPSKQQSILDLAVRDLSLLDEKGTNWEGLQKVAQKFLLNSKLLDEIVDFKANNPNEKKDDIYSLQSVDASRSASYQSLLLQIDIATCIGINDAIKRYNEMEFPKYPEVFWHEVFNQLGEFRVHDALFHIVHAEDSSLYTIETALENFPQIWRNKLSILNAFPQISFELSKRFCLELLTPERIERFIERTGFGDFRQRIQEGILEGLSNRTDFFNENKLFQFVGIGVGQITCDEALNILESSLLRFEKYIENDYGDGPWKSHFIPLKNPTEAFSGYIWSSLGSPISKVRWQAAHCVRRLAILGCTEELDALMNWMCKDTVSAFGYEKFPFYNLHAQQFLLIAFARVSLENSSFLIKHSSKFSKYALEGNPHVLIQRYSSEIALSIEAGFPGTYSGETIKKLHQVSKSPFPIKKLNKVTRKEIAPFPVTKNIDLPLKFSFSWNFDRYWFDPLGGVFDISEKHIQELAHEIVMNNWKIKNDDQFTPDPRRDVFKDGDLNTYHSHGDYPKTDDYRFYLSYHAMLTVAQKLFMTMPIITEYLNDMGNPVNEWEDWIRRHLLTRNDGRWLSDRRDMAPLKKPKWLEEKLSEDWHKDISEEDFLLALSVEQNHESWINIRGSWNESDGYREETINITTALVSKLTSQSLLNAFSTCLNSYDYKIPTYNEDSFEIDFKQFKLHGWIDDKYSSSDLDSQDPHSAHILYPCYKLGKDFITKFGLTSDLDEREWCLSSTDIQVLNSSAWILTSKSKNEGSLRSGNRLDASIDFLKYICKTLDKELIFEVKITRRFRSSNYGRNNDNEQSRNKIYIFSENGYLRDERTSYQFRESLGKRAWT